MARKKLTKPQIRTAARSGVAKARKVQPAFGGTVKTIGSIGRSLLKRRAARKSVGNLRRKESLLTARKRRSTAGRRAGARVFSLGGRKQR